MSRGDWTDVLEAQLPDEEDQESKDCAKALLADFKSKVEGDGKWQVQKSTGDERNGVAWIQLGPDCAGILIWGYAVEFVSTEPV